AAGFVDREIAAAADRVSGHQLEGLIATAMARHDSELAEQVAAERAEQRGVQIRLDQTGLAGLTEVSGWVDLPDALDLEAALSHSAQQLAAWGSADPLNVRRARALGELAREHLTFQGQPVTGSSSDDHADHADDTADGQACDAGTGGHGGVRVRSRRQVVLYVHLTDAAIYDMLSRGPANTGHPGISPSGSRGGAAPEGGDSAAPDSGDSAGCGVNGEGWRVPVWVGRVENTATPITAETIRAWCADPHTRVAVRPVLDLNGYQQADSYEVPGRIKEQLRLRDGTCVFPNCRAKALYCQDDHVEPYDHADPEAGGRTETTNLRLLCQRHHNLKTHHGFRYLILTNGAVLWRTPHGLRIRRNRDGTVDYLTRHQARHRPDTDDGDDSGVEAGHQVETTTAAGGRRRGIPGLDALDGLANHELHGQRRGSRHSRRPRPTTLLNHPPPTPPPHRRRGHRAVHDRASG
ncbi:HNH endonuclease signature motif containing protein, partial [Pseudactinotalea suaedae]